MTMIKTSMIIVEQDVIVLKRMRRFSFEKKNQGTNVLVSYTSFVFIENLSGEILSFMRGISNFISQIVILIIIKIYKR